MRVTLFGPKVPQRKKLYQNLSMVTVAATLLLAAILLMAAMFLIGLQNKYGHPVYFFEKYHDAKNGTEIRYGFRRKPGQTSNTHTRTHTDTQYSEGSPQTAHGPSNCSKLQCGNNLFLY